jgi:hypothetical protein
MKNILLFLLVAFVGFSSGTKRYVSTTGDNNNAGTISAPYRTVVKGVSMMVPGDSLLIRGGTYIELTIDISGKVGTAANKYYVGSYPGEWAKIDRNHTGNGSVFKASNTWANCIQYWKFERLEVTGGGPAIAGVPYDNSFSGCGFEFWPARNIEFRMCYIHDNYGGGQNNGGAGIYIQNRDNHGAQGIKITYCYLADNGWPGNNNENTQNIVLFSDYNDDPTGIVDTSGPLKRNEIAYNLSDRSAMGIKTKSCQRLMRENYGDSATSLDWKNLGDKIHHNIIRRPMLRFMAYEQDFQQIYNNIFDGRGATGVVTLGPMQSMDDREAFHTVMYNNTFISNMPYTTGEGCAVSFDHGRDLGAGSNYDQFTEQYHPYLHFYNNVIFSMVGDRDMCLHVNSGYYGTATRPAITVNNWSTINISNNFFGDRTDAEKAFCSGFINSQSVDGVGQTATTGYTYSINKMKTYSTSNVNHAKVVAIGSLFSDTGKILLNSSCITYGTSTIANSGKGGNHPYLDIALPTYLGAAITGDTWTTTVLSLVNLSTLAMIPEETPPASYADHDFVSVRRDSVITITGGNLGIVEGDVYLNAINIPVTSWNNSTISLAIPSSMPRGYYTRKIYNSSAALIDSFYHGVRVVVPAITKK